MSLRLALLSLVLIGARLPADIIKSEKSGPWSEAATWTGGAVPGAGAKVLIKPGHTVLYDIVSDQAIRSIFVGGRRPRTCFISSSRTNPLSKNSHTKLENQPASLNT